MISDRHLNIMFTCAGRRVALMDAFRLAMAELGISGKVLATDMTVASPAFHRADHGILVPAVGCIDYIPSLLDAARKHDVGLIIPLTDLDLRSLGRRRGRFQEIGCEVMIGSEECVTLCRDKARISDMVAKAGLKSIRTCTLTDFRANPFYPAFVKPIRGSASVGTGLIHNEKELTAHVATYGDLLIVQEYIGGQEFTVDVFRSRAGKVLCAVPRQRLAVRSGEVEKGMTVKDDVLIDSVIKLSANMGDMWGVYCCQCRRDGSGEPRFFEINLRFGGGAMLSIAAGANLPLYVLQERLGLPVTAQLGRFTDRMLMLRYDEAVYLTLDDANALPDVAEMPKFR